MGLKKTLEVAMMPYLPHPFQPQELAIAATQAGRQRIDMGYERFVPWRAGDFVRVSRRSRRRFDGVIPISQSLRKRYYTLTESSVTSLNAATRAIFRLAKAERHRQPRSLPIARENQER